FCHIFSLMSSALSLPDALPIDKVSVGEPAEGSLPSVWMAPSRGRPSSHPCLFAPCCFGGPALRGRRGASPPPGPCPPGTSTMNRSEAHTSELQSRFDLVCRLLL